MAHSKPANGRVRAPATLGEDLFIRPLVKFPPGRASGCALAAGISVEAT
jgi:hypothetical protein